MSLNRLEPLESKEPDLLLLFPRGLLASSSKISSNSTWHDSKQLSVILKSVSTFLSSV